MVCPALAEKPGQSGGLKSASALGAENALPLGNSIAVCSPTNRSRGNDFRYREMEPPYSFAPNFIHQVATLQKQVALPSSSPQGFDQWVMTDTVSVVLNQLRNN